MSNPTDPFPLKNIAYEYQKKNILSSFFCIYFREFKLNPEKMV